MSIILFFSIFILQCYAQEVQISFQEEIVLDIVPYPSCPDGTEPLVLPNNENVCATSLLKNDEKRREMVESETLDIFVTISLALTDEQSRDYNLSSLLNETGEIHFSFQEFFALEIEEEEATECSQGFDVLWLSDRKILEFGVCSNRLSITNDLPYSIISNPLFNYIFSLNYVGCSKGYQQILLGQEFMACVPCFPGTFCIDSSAFFCPQGSYTPMYGQEECLTCPFDMTSRESKSISFEDCQGDNIISSLVHNFTIEPSIFEYNNDLLEAEISLKKTLLKILENLNIGEVHILKWEL